MPADRTRRLKPVPERAEGRCRCHGSPFAADHRSARSSARSRRPFDLLRVPLLGRFLRWRHARVCLQLPLLLLALCIVFDGFFGPPIAGMNLAGVLPWIHWRGLVVLGLLAAGNVFCMACPFMLPRAMARRFRTATRSWPPWLRNKWPAVVLLVVFLWAYEAFALWDSPWLTAAIVLAYFAAAFLIDGLFRGASFCKYVCPIGQFNFVQSLVSPLEVKVREPDVCSSCRTKDCIRGRDEIPGCELGLYQPRKSSNMDCTFCLDCIHACPHQNIGIIGERAAARAVARPAPFRSRPVQPPHRPGRAVRRPGGRRIRQCGIDDRRRFWICRVASRPRSGSALRFVATTALCLLALVVLPLLDRRWHGGCLALVGPFQRDLDRSSRRDLLCSGSTGFRDVAGSL